MYARGRSRCARSVALEGSRGVTRNVTRFGKHNYVSRPVAYRYVDTRRHTHAQDMREREERVSVGACDECENIEGLRRNIARCVMHERASDSRRVNKPVDRCDQTKKQKKVRSSEV